jgi:serine/threonine protein kinase
MVAVKRIGLDGLKEEEISQLMREVDLVKRLTHPSIVKYEGMARDENALSIVLEYVFRFPLYIAASLPRGRALIYLSADFFCASWYHHVQICREWVTWTDS